jgi:hypothetical protein
MSRMNDRFIEEQDRNLDRLWDEVGWEYDSREEWEEEYRMSQEAMPPHKRDGYAEQMADYADHLRDLARGK